MFSEREVATLLAALTYWQEEMCPHGRAIMRPYLRTIGCDQVTPLNRMEIVRLSSRLKKLLKSLYD